MKFTIYNLNVLWGTICLLINKRVRLCHRQKMLKSMSMDFSYDQTSEVHMAT